MALTDRLQIVVDCFPDPDGGPDSDRIESADRELFKMIRSSVRFPTAGVVRLLDIGSGSDGSDFVNRYGREFPNADITYLDRAPGRLEKLDRPNKVYADATQMPFQDESFDIAYAGYVIPYGVLKNNPFSKDESFRIAKEGHRVIKRDGLFVFTYCMGDDLQTLVNLSEIGFKTLEHLQRLKWYGGLPADTYAARK